MNKRVTKNINKIMIIFVALCLCLAIARLSYICLTKDTFVDGKTLKEFASSRNEKKQTLYASRGTIFDMSGEALAQSVNSYNLIAYTNPNYENHVENIEETAKALAPLLNAEESYILERLQKGVNTGLFQVEFGTKGRNLTETVKKKIEALELPGIDFTEGVQRYYRMGSFASYIIGYAKTNDDGQINGELGVEGYYNKELSGTDGYRIYQSDALGYPLPDKTFIEEPEENGHDIYLTIDSKIQLIAENVIKNLTNNYQLTWGIFAVMDAETGAIVASATTPSYNPNDLNTLQESLNPLVSYTYEPGSTMKTFTWAAAIEEGLYKGDEKYHSGSIEVADRTINDWNNGEGWGDIEFDTGYIYSSNVAASILADRLGVANLSDYLYKFGFGKKTGIELANEYAGGVNIEKGPSLATAAFGQGGIEITPIQMLQALSMIANDGVMLKPYIVDKIVDENGNIIKQNGRVELGQKISKETAKQIRELMYGVTYKNTVSYWQPKSVTFIGKTGTAQITAPGQAGYLKGEYDTIASFAGMFPKDDPKYIVYFATKQLVASQPNFAHILTTAVDDIASYANIATEVENNYEDNIITLENYKSQTVESVKNNLEEKGIKVEIIGDGKYVINQYPLQNTKIVKNARVFIMSNSYNYLMPDVKGWSLADVNTYMSFIGVKVTSSGYGYVESQSIEPKTPITAESRLNVILKANDNIPKSEPLPQESEKANDS